MKKSELFFSVLQVLLDWVAIVAAAAFAYKLRHLESVQILINKQGIYNFTFEQYMYIALWFSVFLLILYAVEGLYNIRATRKAWHEVTLIIKSTTIALVIVMIGFFLQREWFSSRFIIVAAWFLIIFAVSFGHIVTRFAQKYLLLIKGIGQHRVLLVGSGQKMTYICRAIQHKPALGYRVVKHVDLINLKRIKKIGKRFGIDEVIVNESEMPDDLLKKLYDYCEINGITYKFVPTSRQTTKFEMGMFNGEPLIELKHTQLDGWGKILKRLCDVIGSSLLIILTSPVMLIVAILVKLEDPDGPIIFKNMRIGSNGKKFHVYKFRYMTWKWCTTRANPNWQKAMEYERDLIENQSVRVGPIYKIKNDPRRMRVGRFLERFSIDEFPQFFNVFKGDMSLIGPRPHQEREVKNYNEYHRRLLTIRPGITGMAQVSGRSDLDFEDEYRLDVYYIENWSLWLDLIILLKTIPAVLKLRNNN
jgi:exopolysaccharide biosynthesis polyprenyl glycosylphosphotransferase